MRGSVRFTGAEDLRGWREIFTRDVILWGKIPDRLELTVTVGHVLTALAARMQPKPRSEDCCCRRLWRPDSEAGRYGT